MYGADHSSVVIMFIILFRVPLEPMKLNESYT